MDFTKILGFLKLGTKTYVSLTLISGILLFLPEKSYEVIDISKFMNDYRPIISIGFLFFSVFTIVNIIGNICWFFMRKHINKKNAIERKKILRSLSDLEKEILHYCINNNRMVDLEIDKGYHTRLQHHEIIYRASSFSMNLTNFPFALNDWAYEYLIENPQLLE